MSNKTEKNELLYKKHHLDITQIYARYRINSNESLKKIVLVYQIQRIQLI